MKESCDFLIAGAGVVGINVAWELKKRHPAARIILIEKEETCSYHASGRNSGVLHAGFYYTADSLKAKFTRQGNQLLTHYCEEKQIPINKCGKLVVAKDEAELAGLDELLRRGQVNQVDIHSISEAEAKEIEPRVKTHQRALWSPTTSSVDPIQVTQAMLDDAKAAGVEVRTNEPYIKRDKDGSIVTSKGTYHTAYFINSAGLYADKIALDFGYSKEYRILPFKGLYLYSDEHHDSFRTNIYPVPDLKNPFLGVHFTITVDGHAKIGPTAIPAFWREQYQGLNRFKAGEFTDIVVRQAGLFLGAGFDFRRLAFEEIQKYSRRKMVDLASILAHGVKPEDYKRWGKPGIRAQLMNLEKKKLEMDFVIQGDHKSLHILNVVSPGFTCSIPFSAYVVDRIEKELHSN